MSLVIDISRIGENINIKFNLYSSIVIICNDKITSIEHKVRNIGNINIRYPDDFYIQNISKVYTLINCITECKNNINILTGYHLIIDKEKDELILKSYDNNKYRDIILSYSQDKDIILNGLNDVLKLMHEINLITEPEIKFISRHTRYDEEGKMWYGIVYKYPSWYKCGYKECKGKICGDNECGIKEGECDYLSKLLINWTDKYTDKLLQSIYKFRDDKNTRILKFNATTYEKIQSSEGYIFIMCCRVRCVAKLDEIIKLMESVKEK